MTIEEFYKSIAPTSPEYEGVMGRLGSERLVRKYLNKMVEDKNFAVLKEAVASGTYQDAFMASHTIKGICMNLNLKPLAESSDLLTEELRSDPDPAKVEELFAQVEKDYILVTEGIKKIE